MEPCRCPEHGVFLKKHSQVVDMSYHLRVGVGNFMQLKWGGGDREEDSASIFNNKNNQNS